jgi:enoyl-CoA hydratase
MAYTAIRVEIKNKACLITLNRPPLNALNSTLMVELNEALLAFDRDPNLGCAVITGSEKAFAAGADLKEVQERIFPAAYTDDFLSDWDLVAARRKPMVAAVDGFALGGGCELAMMCDIIIAADTARFGQPEIKLGMIPGIGGTQRLTRVIGKWKAMELCLTGRMMDAQEAERAGLVSRIVPAYKLIEEALKTADVIASMSMPATLVTKESINRAYETVLAEGLRFERRMFQALFATQDQKEGVRAFVEKRAPRFTNL